MRTLVIKSDTLQSVKWDGNVEILMIKYISLISLDTNTLISAVLTGLEVWQCYKYKAHVESVRVCEAGLTI